MYKAITSLLLLSLGCGSAPEMIQEDQVINTIEGFFHSLDVENEDDLLINEYVTHDFIIYEAGMKMTRQEFTDMIAGMAAAVKETDWKLSDYRISTDINSAHASLLNTGTFIIETDSATIRQNIRWLESAYLVREGEKLKIKFYFSDNFSSSMDTIR